MMQVRAIDVALTQLDVVEATGNNDGVPAERYNAGEKLPWCAAFVLYCNAHSDEVKIAEYRTPRWYTMRAVVALDAYCTAQGWKLPPKSRPQRGDIIFFASRGTSDTGSGRHVGLVENVDGLVVHTVEGNVSNRVSRQQHDLGDTATRARVSGYARVPFQGP